VPQVPSAALSTVTVTPGEGLDADASTSRSSWSLRGTCKDTRLRRAVTIAASVEQRRHEAVVVTNPLGRRPAASRRRRPARTLAITLDPATKHNPAWCASGRARSSPGVARYFDVDGNGKAGGATRSCSPSTAR
jgi:hypothetical protein